MTNMYILNTHSIHNYKDINDAIPPQLPLQRPLSVDGATVRAAAVARMARKPEDDNRAKMTTAHIPLGGAPAPANGPGVQNQPSLHNQALIQTPISKYLPQVLQ